MLKSTKTQFICGVSYHEYDNFNKKIKKISEKYFGNPQFSNLNFQ